MRLRNVKYTKNIFWGKQVKSFVVSGLFPESSVLKKVNFKSTKIRFINL